MSVQDMIKKSVLESGVFDSFNASKMAISLIVALLLGAVIYMVYSKFYVGVIFSRSFAVTLVGMTLLTCMVTLAISTNIVISLGMVTTGAGMYVLALIAAVVMIAMIFLFYHKQQKGRIYIAVIHYQGDEAGDEIIRSFGKMKYFIKSKTMRGEKTEMAVEVFCRQNELNFTEKIRKITNVEDITLIQYNGEYHG